MENLHLIFRYLLKIKFFLTLFYREFCLFSHILFLFIFSGFRIIYPPFNFSFYVFLTSLTGFFESLFFIKKKCKVYILQRICSFSSEVNCNFFNRLFNHYSGKISLDFSFFRDSLHVNFLFDFYFSKRAYPNLSKNKRRNRQKEIRKFILSLNVQNIALTILAQAGILF